MMFTIQMTQPDLKTPALPLPVRLSVETLTWQADGGPGFARLRADARDLGQLWQLADRLRCGLTITDRRGPAWWGCLTAVELRQGGQSVRLALDEISSQVCVSFRDYGGQLHSTAWFSDAESLRRYGLKQRRVSLPAGWEGDAAAYAARLLAETGRPRPTAQVRSAGGAASHALAPAAAPGAASALAGGGAPAALASYPSGSTDSALLEGGYANIGRPYALLEGRGWWDTLGWTYYSDPRGRLGWEKGGTSQDWGGGDPFQKVHWSFTCPPGDPWTLTEVWVKLGRCRASDAVRLTLSTGQNNLPGSPLASAVVSAVEMSDALDWVRFALDPAVPVAAETVYWLSLARSGPADPDSSYRVSLDEGLGNTRSETIFSGSGGYLQRTPAADICFQLLGVEETSAQLKRILTCAEGAGQFFSGARIEQASGVLRQPY